MNAKKKQFKGESHTAKSPKGMGDFYGSAIKAKIGKVRDSTVGIMPVSALKLKKPPKSLA